MTTTQAEHTVTFLKATALLKRSQARLDAAGAKDMEAASLIGLKQGRLTSLLVSLLLPGRAARARQLMEESARLELETKLLMCAVRRAITGTPPPGPGSATQRTVEPAVPSRLPPTVHLR